MAGRGMYSKGVARREEILTAALRVIARDGYTAATVQQLADEVGTSKTALLHYFGTKDALFREVLRRRDREQVAGYLPESEDFRDAVIREALHDSAEPGLAQLHTRLGAEAITPEHAAHEYFQHRYEDLRSIGVEQLQRLRAAGDISSEVDVRHLALLMTAVLDGLQLQRHYDPRLDLARVLESFWKLVGKNADGTGPENINATTPSAP